jgi:hypothetical protein
VTSPIRLNELYFDFGLMAPGDSDDVSQEGITDDLQSR